MRIARAQPVIIRLPEVGDLPARVDSADAETVTLVLAVVPDGRIPALGTAAAVVEYTTPTGIHRIAGALSQPGDDPAVLRLDRSAADHVQRRAFARADAVVTTRVRFEDPSTDLVATVTLNVSGGGALIRDPVGLPLGARVGLELRLDANNPPIAAAGRVVRETDAGDKGVQIDDIDTADRERLIRFVMDRQRAQMRLRRPA